ncbi:sugar ABC transporter permease [Paenibacillus sp. JTLBN-2024]
MFSSLSYNKQKTIVIVSFLLIPLILLATFTYYPAVKLIYYSFTNWDGYSPEKPWVGLDNYKEVFSNPDIFKVFEHNFAYFVMGIIQNIIAIYFAVVLNSKLRGRNLFRILLFLPYIMNGVAVAFMFGYVFDTTNGSLNLFLNSLGLTSLGETSWLGTDGLVNYSLASTGLWRFMGYNMVIYIASLQAIPRDLYEAAKIDEGQFVADVMENHAPEHETRDPAEFVPHRHGGAGSVRSAVRADQGGPAGASETYVQRVVDTAFAYNNYGLASAMSVVLLGFVVIVLAVQQFVLSRGGNK